MNKIVRTICLFGETLQTVQLEKFKDIEDKLQSLRFQIQTKRVCSNDSFEKQNLDLEDIYVCAGSKSTEYLQKNLNLFYSSSSICNLELGGNREINPDHVDILFNLIKNAPHKTFDFTYVFNNAPNSPFMPSANFKEPGFSIGFQLLNLAENAQSLEGWFENIQNVFDDIHNTFKDDPEYLGIDSSIAPLGKEWGSLVYILKNLTKSSEFRETATTDTYTQITNFIKSENPKPIGLCGIMLPCLEDYYLTQEYEKGEFSIERNLFLSLHSGLGIDTYPIGIDESPKRVLEILKLVQALSNKYNKPLAVRFVSDGKAKIRKKTEFKNKFLFDTTIRKI